MAESDSKARGAKGRAGTAQGNGGNDGNGDLPAGALQGGLPKSPILASPMDGLNRAIVSLLEQDGRLPFKEIAERLEVSEGTVRNRVNWMKRSGMLRIVAIADPTAFHYKADAMLGLKVASSSSPKKVAERLARHPEVVYILWVTGRFDLLVEIVTDSEESFLEFLERHCHDQADIAQIEVMSGLAMYKNQFLLKRDLP
ncbi:MAG: AsnC family transcriptional regulator [Pseudomonadota bacterium]